MGNKAKDKFNENGGFKSPKNYAMIIMFMWMLYTVTKERGWLPFKKDVRGKHIFLTGAASGIGRLMAIKLAKMGAKLSLSDMNLEGLEETRRMIMVETGSIMNIHIMHLDVTQRD